MKFSHHLPVEVHYFFSKYFSSKGIINETVIEPESKEDDKTESNIK